MSKAKASGLDSVPPKERAAHIACAVVLTIVGVSAIVALIVYFTVPQKKCSDVDTAHDAAVKRVSAPKRKTTRTDNAKTETSGLPLNAGKFRERTAASDLVDSANPKGVHRMRHGTYNDQLSRHRQDYGKAMNQDPMRNQIIDPPILHNVYNHGVERGDLPDQYTDDALFSKHAATWRKQGNLRYGQSDAHTQFLAASKNQYHTSTIRS